MAADLASLRRRAVYACLSGMLDEAAVMQILSQLSQTLRSDQATDVIRFVDSLAGPFGLDAAQSKRLYADIYRRMREPEANLPLDPLPQPAYVAPPPVMPAYAPQPYGAPAGYMPPPMGYPAMPGYPGAAMPGTERQPMVNPVAAALAAASVAPPVVQAAAPAPAPAPAVDLSTLPVEPQMVFGAVLRRVISEVADHHIEALDEIRKDAFNHIEKSRLSSHAEAAFRDAWAQPRQSNWQIRATQGDLAELTRVVYLALLDAFGRAGADQILQRALQLADSMPESRQFSPRRLLAAM
jgi:hypothetical protein